MSSSSSFTPVRGTVYRRTFKNGDASTVKCIWKWVKGEKDAYELFELRRGSLTGPYFDRLWFASWADYEKYLETGEGGFIKEDEQEWRRMMRGE